MTTPTARAKFFLAHNGICHICNRRIAPGEKWEIEHVTPKGLGGSEGDNRRPAHVDCHAGKTRSDVKSMRKADRVAKKHLGIRNPSKFQTSRSGRFKRKLDGTVIDRETGEPV